MTIKNVAIVGASGRLGPHVLQALQTSHSFNITVLKRATSKATYPASVKTMLLPDGLPAAELADVLQGQDALVVTMFGSAVQEQIALANACVAAGVKRFIPADFGSVDSSDERCLELVPLYKNKTEVREHLKKLAADNPNFSWTSLVCGHFFDHGLESGLLGFDMTSRTADIFDGGDAKFSASTLSRIGEAVVKVLQREAQTRDKMLYIQSFCVSQNDVQKALETVSGRTFSANLVTSNHYIQLKKKEMDSGSKQATEELVSVLGITRADWTAKDTFANPMLDLTPETLDSVVRQVLGSSN